HAAPDLQLRVAAASHDESVALVDLRAPGSADRDASRAKLADQLDQLQGVHVARDGMLDSALAGDGGGDSDAQASLDAARAAYGRLDCKTARPAAEHAALAFARRQASGASDGNGPRAAWAYVFLCADRDGDRAAAGNAATMLRALGVTSAGDAGIGPD